MSTISAKIAETGETCEFFLTANSSIDQLRGLLSSLLQIEGSFKLRYRDSEGDWVTISTTQEVVDVLRTYPHLILEVSNAKKIVKMSDYGLKLSEPTVAAAKVVMEKDKANNPPPPSSASAASASAPSAASSSASVPAADSLVLKGFEAQRLLLQLAMLKGYFGIQPESRVDSVPSELPKALVADAASLYSQLLASVRSESSGTRHILTAISHTFAQYGVSVPSDFNTSLAEALSAVDSPGHSTSSGSHDHFRFSETESVVLVNPTLQFQAKPAAEAPEPVKEETASELEEANNLLEAEVPADDFVMVSDSTDEIARPEAAVITTPETSTGDQPVTDPVSMQSPAPAIPEPTPAPAAAPELTPAPATTSVPKQETAPRAVAAPALTPVVSANPFSPQQIMDLDPYAPQANLEMMDTSAYKFVYPPTATSAPPPAATSAPAPVPASTPSTSTSTNPFYSSPQPQPRYNPPAQNQPQPQPQQPHNSAVDPFDDYPPAQVPYTPQFPPSPHHSAPVPIPAPVSAPAPAPDRWASELRHLRSMGFSDEERNKQALDSFNGDLETTIASLVSE